MSLGSAQKGQIAVLRARLLHTAHIDKVAERLANGSGYLGHHRNQSGRSSAHIVDRG